MVIHKNFDITPGFSAKLEFKVEDETGIEVNTTDYSARLEFLNSDGSLFKALTVGFDFGIGIIKCSISDIDTKLLTKGLYRYRCILTDTNLVSSLAYSGFIACSEPTYLGVNSNSQGIILPNGSLYIGSPVNINFGDWYEISSYYRFLVNGIGILSLDVRNNTDIINLRIQYYESPVSDTQQWIPYLGQNTSFRINSISGNCVVTYLP
jgi:hypothetical protein